MTSKTNRVGSGGNQIVHNAKGSKISHPLMMSESPKIIYNSSINQGKNVSRESLRSSDIYV